ncbi:transcriptional regulator [filamentous cyanobacterium CCP5]|nr:transcriptional regulator [filamentous cyanobacterium CCP5]
MLGMKSLAPELQHHWEEIAPLLTIRNGHDYELAVERLNELLDEVGTEENHPLYSFLDTLGTLIEAYEAEYHPVPEAKGAEAFQYLAEEHGLSPDDFSDIGPPDQVRSILNGDCELNASQIRILAQQFGVSPAVFI